MSLQKSLSLKKYSVSDRNFLDRRQEPSVRYAFVKSKTNSGFNASKRQEIEKEIAKYYNVRGDEVFKRIFLGDLIQLIVAYAEEINIVGLPPSPEEDATNSVAIESVEDQQHLKNETSNLNFSSDQQKLVEVSNSTPATNQLSSCPYLLIDVRSENEYNEYHLATSICHPHSRLSRSVGWESNEMRHFKNHADKIIVIYDENETLSSDVASVLIHRGYLNIYVLSGGMKLTRDKFGFPFVTKDRSKILSSSVANFLSERLTLTVLPPHQMHDTFNWLETKLSKNRTQSSKMERENEISKEKSLVKKIPWK